MTINNCIQILNKFDDTKDKLLGLVIKDSTMTAYVLPVFPFESAVIYMIICQSRVISHVPVSVPYYFPVFLHQSRAVSYFPSWSRKVSMEIVLGAIYSETSPNFERVSIYDTNLEK